MIDIRAASEFEAYYRLLYLRVAPSIVRFFDIESLKIGRDEQLVTTSRPLPASSMRWDVFRPIAIMSREGPPQLRTYLGVRNHGRKPHHFKAYLEASIHWTDDFPLPTSRF